jgi:hypothetical protein
MSKFTYKNVSDTDIIVPGYGVVKKNHQFTTDKKIETPALREVTARPASKPSSAKATENKTVSKDNDDGTAGN